MYLLDTNVVSELRKVKSGKANKNVKDWSSQLDPQRLFISSIPIILHHQIQSSNQTQYLGMVLI